MLFSEKNDNGIELHLNFGERAILYMALRHYSTIIEDLKTINEIMNVLELPEFKEK